MADETDVSTSSAKKRLVLHAPMCEFDHPHPDHPCGRPIIPRVTTCTYCGNLDGSPECDAAGCWQPATQADVDALICEAMESGL